MPQKAAPIDLTDSFEKIPVKIYPDLNQGSVYVARQIANLIREKQNKKEKCVISNYEQPEITHLLNGYMFCSLDYCIRNLKLPIFFNAMPVPRTTARSGSSAMCTGNLVFD